MPLKRVETGNQKTTNFSHIWKNVQSLTWTKQGFSKELQEGQTEESNSRENESKLGLKKGML